jgi:hypothetical protein
MDKTIKRKRLIKRKQSRSDPIKDKIIKGKLKEKPKSTRRGNELISESGKRKSFKKIPIGKKPVLGDVTQGFKDTIQSVIDEGGSPKLTTTKAIVDRSADKLGVPKLALKGGGRAYGKNS